MDEKGVSAHIGSIEKKMVPITLALASFSHAHLRLRRRAIRTTIHMPTSGRLRRPVDRLGRALPASLSLAAYARAPPARPPVKSIVRAIMCKWIAIAADGKRQLESKCSYCSPRSPPQSSKRGTESLLTPHRPILFDTEQQHSPRREQL